MQKPPRLENRSTAPVTLESGSRSTICNPTLAPEVMQLHTILEKHSFILSQDIVRNPQSIKNWSTAPVTLKSGSRSTIYTPMLASEVM